jgi:hypothetical protein
VVRDRPADYETEFDLPRQGPVTPLNVDLSTLSAATDVALGYGEPLREIFDLNFQSGCDPFVDRRVHLYNAVFGHRYHVEVRSLLILLRPKADHPNLTGKLSYGKGDTSVKFRYKIIRMWQRPVQTKLPSALLGSRSVAYNKGCSAKGGMKMTPEKVEKQRYMVSVYEAKGVPGAFKFTFVPRGLKEERCPGSAPKRVPQHILQVNGTLDNPAFDWSASPDAPGPDQSEMEQIARDRLASLGAWLNRVGDLVGRVEQWGKELGWATRRIDKRLNDSGVGSHKVPALLLQEETVRVLLEPVARRALGADGVVDLYLMPAYDDVASLYFREGAWHVHYVFPGAELGATIKEAESMSLSKETLAAILQEMKKHGQ